MDGLENGSDDEIGAHLERYLQLNALEKSHGLPIATMTTSTTKAKRFLNFQWIAN